MADACCYQRAVDGLVARRRLRYCRHGPRGCPTGAADGRDRQHLATAAVVNAAGPDAYQKFHDLLYAHQPAEGGSGLTDDQLISYFFAFFTNQTLNWGMAAALGLVLLVVTLVLYGIYTVLARTTELKWR